MRRLIPLLFASLVMVEPLAANAACNPACITCDAAQIAAAKKTAVAIKAEQPSVNNPTDRAVRGPQCVNQVSSFEQIEQLLESLPIGGQGQQIVQTILQLFGPAQNACNPYVTAQNYVTPQGGSLPKANPVTNAPLPVTQFNDGNKNGGSSLYQSIFP